MQASTPSQAAALQAIERFLADPTTPVFLLEGAAGTGKSHLVRKIVDRLSASNRVAQLMAPTGRAAKVLQERTGERAGTIHGHIFAFHKLIEAPPHDHDPVESFRLIFGCQVNELPNGTVFIVDEASMVGDVEESSDNEFLRFGSGRLLTDLVQYVFSGGPDRNNKLIFVGDPAQLPPVGSPFSPAFDRAYLQQEHALTSARAELTDVVRQRAAGGILSQAGDLRQQILNRRYDRLELRSAPPEVHSLPAIKVIDTFLSDVAESGDENAIVVTHSNSEATHWNLAIRERRWPGRRAVHAGDRLVVNRNNYRFSLMNGEFVRVLSAEETVDRRPLIQGLSLDFRRAEILIEPPDRPATVENCLLVDDLFEARTRDLEPVYQQALYVDFKLRHPHLKPQSEEFDRAMMNDPYINALHAKFGYAVTGHKSQGGEWGRVTVVFPGSELRHDSGLRWCYTAITRAQERLYLVNAPLLRAYSGVTLQRPATLGTSAPPSPSPIPTAPPTTAAESTPATVHSSPGESGSGAPLANAPAAKSTPSNVASSASLAPAGSPEGIEHQKAPLANPASRSSATEQAGSADTDRRDVSASSPPRPTEGPTSSASTLPPSNRAPATPAPMSPDPPAAPAAPAQPAPNVAENAPPPPSPLDDLARQIRDALTSGGLQVQDLQTLPYRLRLTVRTESHDFRFDLIHDKHHKITGVQPLPPSPRRLVANTAPISVPDSDATAAKQAAIQHQLTPLVGRSPRPHFGAPTASPETTPEGAVVSVDRNLPDGIHQLCRDLATALSALSDPAVSAPRVAAQQVGGYEFELSVESNGQSARLRGYFDGKGRISRKSGLRPVGPQAPATLNAVELALAQLTGGMP